MRLFGIIGYPLTHTSSPAYFLEKFKQEGIAGCDYRAFPLQNINEFPALLKQFPELEGLNVTIPYKEAVLQYVHHRSAVVEACGATNCLKIQNGIITAFNTDAAGFEQSLVPLLQQGHTHALILGTGGAAKAVAWVLHQRGIQYLFVSRQTAFQNESTINYSALTSEIINKHKLIINASPAGMFPDADRFPELNYQWLTPQHLLYDLVYKPEKTLFLQKGAEYGAVIKNGYEMLQLQAEAGWGIWTGNAARG